MEFIMTKTRELTLIGVTILFLAAGGCAKKKVARDKPQTPDPTRTAMVMPLGSVPGEVKPVVTEHAPTAQDPGVATEARIDELLKHIEDAFFDYDKHTLRPDAIKALEADSTELRGIIVQYRDYELIIEGHCDERGSAEYNMQLGEARAEAAKTYLVEVGIPAAQLSTISYGKEMSGCDDHEEACWQKNRRIHIVGRFGDNNRARSVGSSSGLQQSGQR
jgi:peptidoglycan-associated lipoprotein